MAKTKQDVNKSQEIRDVLTANPKIKASEVVAKLAEKGVEVKAGLVYIIKGKLQAEKGS